MNSSTSEQIPQVSDRIQSLFQEAKRYRDARKIRQRNEQPLTCEQQLQLSLKASSN